MEIKINGINKIKNAWKNYNIVINQVELKNGDISGTFEGKLIMEQSKKITNNELLEFFSGKFDDINRKFDYINKKFDDIDKKFDDIDKKFDDIDKKFEIINKKIDNMDKKFEKKFDIIDKKLDLMLATPTMNKEIDHEALNKLR